MVLSKRPSREEMELRLALLDAMEASSAMDDEAIAIARTTWQDLATPFLGRLEGE